VTVETRGFKQTGEEVISFERTVLVPKRDPETDNTDTDE